MLNKIQTLPLLLAACSLAACVSGATPTMLPTAIPAVSSPTASLRLISTVAPTLTSAPSPIPTLQPTETLEPTPTEYVLDYSKWEVFSNSGIPMCCNLQPLSEAQRKLVGQVRTAEYTDSEGKKFQLNDGVYFSRCSDFSLPCYIYLIEPAAFGDLDGDGVDDIAILAEAWNGGTAIDYELGAVINKPTKLNTIPFQYLGDRVKIQGMQISRGIILLKLLVHGPQDGLCCPSQKAIWRFQVANGGLKRLP